MQLYETSWIQNIVKIQMSISAFFPRDFVSLSLYREKEVCSLFTALMYRRLILVLFDNAPCCDQAEAGFISLNQALQESEARVALFLTLMRYYFSFTTSFRRN